MTFETVFEQAFLVVFSWRTCSLLLIFLKVRALKKNPIYRGSQISNHSIREVEFCSRHPVKKAVLSSKVRSVAPVGWQPLSWASCQASTLGFSTNVHRIASNMVVSHSPSASLGCVVLVFSLVTENLVLKASTTCVHWEQVNFVDYLNAVSFWGFFTIWITSGRAEIKLISEDFLFGTVIPFVPLLVCISKAFPLPFPHLRTNGLVPWSIPRNRGVPWNREHPFSKA